MAYGNGSGPKPGRQSSSVQGIIAVRKELKAIRHAFATPLLRKAVRAGARVVRKEARAQLGKSRKQQLHIVTQDRRTGVAAGEAVTHVGIRRAGFYLRFLHEGAKGHDIKPKKKKALAIKTKHFALGTSGASNWNGRWVVLRKGVVVKHPGQRASNKFLLKAGEIKHDEAASAMRKVYDDALATVPVGHGGA